MNVIYIHTHDSGAVISPYGFKVPSPNIEAFAEKSLLFRKAFATAPTCSPSRSSLMTGQYPSSHGQIGLCNRNFVLNDKSQHLAHFLSTKGYETVLSGIQHEGGHYNESKRIYKTLGYQKNISTDIELSDLEDKRIWDDKNTENTVKWIETRDSKAPFYLSIGYFGTHRQFPKAEKNYRSLPPHDLALTETVYNDFNSYCASLENVDNNFKKIMDALESKGHLENSIIFFTSDHGIGFPFSKCNLYDSGVNVALLFYTPNSKSNGKITNSLVSQIDIFPTICDLLGFDKPDYLQGKSLVPILQSFEEEVNEYVFGEMTFHTSFEPARFVRNERYKLIKYLDTSFPQINLSNINQSATKNEYIKNGLASKYKALVQLFDLYYDPSEKNNIAEDPNYIEIRKELEDVLDHWRITVGDPLLNDDFEWNKEWIVNKRTSVVPSSKDKEDYIQGFELRKKK